MITQPAPLGLVQDDITVEKHACGFGPFFASSSLFSSHSWSQWLSAAAAATSLLSPGPQVPEKLMRYQRNRPFTHSLTFQIIIELILGVQTLPGTGDRDRMSQTGAGCPDYSLVGEGRPPSFSGLFGVFLDKPSSEAELGGVSGTI